MVTYSSDKPHQAAPYYGSYITVIKQEAPDPNPKPNTGIGLNRNRAEPGSETEPGEPNRRFQTAAKCLRFHPISMKLGAKRISRLRSCFWRGLWPRRARNEEQTDGTRNKNKPEPAELALEEIKTEANLSF